MYCLIYQIIVVIRLDFSATPGHEPELGVGVHADEHLKAVGVLDPLHFIHNHLCLDLARCSRTTVGVAAGVVTGTAPCGGGGEH